MQNTAVCAHDDIIAQAENALSYYCFLAVLLNLRHNKLTLRKGVRRLPEFLLLFFLLIIFLALAMIVPLLKVRRAAVNLLKLFKEAGALNPETAQALGTITKGPKQGRPALPRRDYQKEALKLLIAAKVVVVTVGETLYFSEEGFKRWPLKKYFIKHIVF